MVTKKHDTTISIKYRIYSNENGLLIEPKHHWGDTKYADYDSIEECSEAIKKNGDEFQGYVIVIVVTGGY